MRALFDVPAPAKLNLFLHVTGRRPDGYHLLESVFMLIDWCDTLHFERRGTDAISREDLGAPLPPDDLVVRAARALQAATGCTQGAHISVLKRIPAQAGMGGGSSDAASTLLALNRLWALKLTTEALAAIGLGLGADVPFFVRGRNAWVQGIGEKVQPLDVPPARVLVVKPPQGLETGAIFGDGRLERDSPPAIISGFAANPWGFGQNDLQPVAERLCPSITMGLELLAQQGWTGRMTGSGSAVFAVVPEDELAKASALELPQGWHSRLCSNLVSHPLYGWAPSDD